MHTNTSTTFQVDDYIFHGGSGVCRIQEICVPRANHTDPDRTYYRLLPLYETGSVIYTPTDNTKSIVRRILTEEEARLLIARLPLLEPIRIDNEKSREEKYRETLRTNSCVEWFRMIKTLYLRNQARKVEGKRFSQTDEKYLRRAETLLYGELAISLRMPRERVACYIACEVSALSQHTEQCS